MAVAAEGNPGWVSVNVLVIALWFGLVAGMVEGIGSLALQQMGWHDGVWVEMLWVAPIFAGLLFGSAGALLVLLYLAVRRLPVLTVAVFLFSSLSAFIVLELVLPWELHIGSLLLLSAGVGSVLSGWFRPRRAGMVQFWRRSLPVVAGLALLLVVVVHGAFWLMEAVA
jgi:hypothetical protein